MEFDHSLIIAEVEAAIFRSQQKSDVDEVKAFLVDGIAKAILRYVKHCQSLRCKCRFCEYHNEQARKNDYIYMQLVQNIAIAFDIVNDPSMSLIDVRESLAKSFKDNAISTVQLCRQYQQCQYYNGGPIPHDAYMQLLINVKQCFIDVQNPSVGNSIQQVQRILARGIGDNTASYIDACCIACNQCLQDNGDGRGHGKKSNQKPSKGFKLYIIFDRKYLHLPWHTTVQEAFAFVDSNDDWDLTASIDPPSTKH